MRSYISRGWLVGMPDVIFHKNAVEAVIAAPKPTRLDHSPRSIRDDFSNTNAFLFDMPRNPIFSRAHDGPTHALPHWLGLRSVTGGAFSGDLLGGGGITGS